MPFTSKHMTLVDARPVLPALPTCEENKGVAGGSGGCLLAAPFSLQYKSMSVSAPTLLDNPL